MAADIQFRGVVTVKVKAFAVLVGLAFILVVGCGRAPQSGRVGSVPAARSVEIRSEGFAPSGVGWVLTQGQLRTTPDAGDTWSAVALPQVALDWKAAVFTDNDSALVGALTETGATVALTTTHGRAWQISLLATSLPQISGDLSIAFDGSAGAVLVRFMTSSNFAAGEIFTTVDGTQWTRYKAPTAGRLGMTSQRTLWIAGGPKGDQLWSSNDLGASWQRVQLPFGAAQITVDVPQEIGNATLILPVTDIASNGFAEESFLQSVDGTKWSLVRRVTTLAHVGQGARLPASVSQGRMYVVEPDGSKTYRGGLSGNTEVRVSSGLPSDVSAVSFTTNGRGWAIVNSSSCTGEKKPGAIPNCVQTGGNFRTSDDGGHWQELIS
jgi:hypothetical protein